MRIVSLLASATELVEALGRAGDLVGRSHEGGRLEEPVDALELERLAPDLILAPASCEAQLKRLRPGCRVLAFAPRGVSDVLEDVERAAAALDARAAGFELKTSMRRRLAEVAGRTKALARPSAAVLEWLDPPLAAGHWIPELVDSAGGKDLFGVAGAGGPWLSLDRLLAADPDVLVAAPRGFPLSRSQPELAGMIQRPDWSRLRAVREGRVYVADGNRHFHRPGPRLPETAEILSEILHPELAPVHETSGWRRLT